MEKKLLDLDLPKLFVMLQRFIKGFEEIRRYIISAKSESQQIRMSHPTYGKILFIEEVAEVLGYTPNTIYRFIKKGKLRSIKPGNRHLFYEKHIIDFLDNH